VGEAMKELNWLLLIPLGVWVFVFSMWLYLTFGMEPTQERWLSLGVPAVGGIGIVLIKLAGKGQM